MRLGPGHLKADGYCRMNFMGALRKHSPEEGEAHHTMSLLRADALHRPDRLLEGLDLSGCQGPALVQPKSIDLPSGSF